MNHVTLRGAVARNPQPIGKDLILAEVQAGKSGRGRVWTPSILVPNPEAGTIMGAGTKWQWTQPTHHVLGYTKPGTGHSRKGLWKVYMYRIIPSRGWLEGYFPTQIAAAQFMVRNAPEFFA